MERVLPQVQSFNVIIRLFIGLFAALFIAFLGDLVYPSPNDFSIVKKIIIPTIFGFVFQDYFQKPAFKFACKLRAIKILLLGSQYIDGMWETTVSYSNNSQKVLYRCITKISQDLVELSMTIKCTSFLVDKNTNRLRLPYTVSYRNIEFVSENKIRFSSEYGQGTLVLVSPSSRTIFLNGYITINGIKYNLTCKRISKSEEEIINNSDDMIEAYRNFLEGSDNP